MTIDETRDGRVEIAIRDDGEGFDAADAPDLFQRGFSTRAHKSGGLGLHWCANSMTAMEGSLRLESDGSGWARWRGWCCAVPRGGGMTKAASAAYARRARAPNRPCAADTARPGCAPGTIPAAPG